MIKEIWKVVKDFPDYQVSNYGRIKSFKKWRGTNERILKSILKDGYVNVVLHSNKRYYKRVHILVYEGFNDYKLKSNECVHHKDKTKNNNYKWRCIIFNAFGNNSYNQRL